MQVLSIQAERKGEFHISNLRHWHINNRKDATHGKTVSVVTMGELRRGVEMIRHRGDVAQARMLEGWLSSVCSEHADSILSFDEEMAQVWGRLRVPHHENPLDKQIAATALIYDLTVLTRNVADFEGTGVRLLNPFSD